VLLLLESQNPFCQHQSQTAEVMPVLCEAEVGTSTFPSFLLPF